MLKFDWLCEKKVNTKSHILRTSWEDTISWVFCNAKSDLMCDRKLNIITNSLAMIIHLYELVVMTFFFNAKFDLMKLSNVK